MENAISQLKAVRRALGTLEVTSTQHNLDVLLGSMQLLDGVILTLQSVKAKKEDSNGRENQS